MLLMAYGDTNITNKEDNVVSYSRSNNHVWKERVLFFFNLDGSFRDSVKLSMKLDYKGNVRLLVNGITQVIIGIFYVLELKNNLSSLRKLQEKDLIILFQHDKCKVFYSDRDLIMDIIMSSKWMFILHATS